MSKEKYVFNQNTLRYEKVSVSWKKRIFKFAAFSTSILLISFILYTIAYTVIPTPKEVAMQRELKQMEYQFSNITSDFEKLAEELNLLQEKDAQVHRVIFGIDPIDESVWEGGTGGSENSEYLSSIKSSEDFASSTRKRLEKLQYKVQLQRVHWIHLWHWPNNVKRN